MIWEYKYNSVTSLLDDGFSLFCINHGPSFAFEPRTQFHATGPREASAVMATKLSLATCQVHPGQGNVKADHHDAISHHY